MKLRLLIVALLLWLCPSFAAAQSIGAVVPYVQTKTLNGVGQSVVVGMGGYTAVLVQVTGSCTTCTLLFETSGDGTNYGGVSLFPPNSLTSVTQTAAAGQWQGSVVSNLVRIRMSARASGSFVVTVRATLTLASLRSTGAVTNNVTNNTTNTASRYYVQAISSSVFVALFQEGVFFADGTPAVPTHGTWQVTWTAPPLTVAAAGAAVNQLQADVNSLPDHDTGYNMSYTLVVRNAAGTNSLMLQWNEAIAAHVTSGSIDFSDAPDVLQQTGTDLAWNDGDGAVNSTAGGVYTAYAQINGAFN